MKARCPICQGFMNEQLISMHYFVKRFTKSDRRWGFKMRSPCCQAEVKVVWCSELYHGCDDGYDLKIPMQVCSCCGEGILPIFTNIDHQVYQSI